MPLDFTHAHAPPTLGKRKTKEEIKRALQKKYDVKAGLREQGGFTNIHSTFTSWDDKRREEYASIIARQEEQATAQFGQIPHDWTYLSLGEVQEIVTTMKEEGFFDRELGFMPRVTVARDTNLHQLVFTVRQDKAMGRFMLSEFQFRDDDNLIDHLQYELNHLIHQVGMKLEAGP